MIESAHAKSLAASHDSLDHLDLDQPLKRAPALLLRRLVQAEFLTHATVDRNEEVLGLERVLLGRGLSYRPSSSDSPASSTATAMSPKASPRF